MKPTIRDLEIKNTRDAEMISLYKKQIAQLAACIKDREGRIDRRQPVIDRISQQEETDFTHALAKAQDRGLMVNGAKYYHRDGFTRVAQLNGKFVLFMNDAPEMASNDLGMLSQSFFFEYPEAKVFLQADDK